jgi:hypothetical protein
MILPRGILCAIQQAGQQQPTDPRRADHRRLVQPDLEGIGARVDPLHSFVKSAEAALRPAGRRQRPRRQLSRGRGTAGMGEHGRGDLG